MTHEERKPKADWLGWCLQLLFGLFVGAAACTVLIAPRRGQLGLWHFPPAAWTVIFGSALLGAGVLSNYGDRFLMGRDLLGSRRQRHSRVSRAASWVIAGLGLTVVVARICWFIRR